MPNDEPTLAVPGIANVAGTTGPPSGSTADLQASEADATLDSASTTAGRGPIASFPARIGKFQIQRLLGERGNGGGLFGRAGEPSAAGAAVLSLSN